MRLYLRLAWRNFWRQRRRTVIIILAIGITMAMMMWYDGTMAGFNQAIYANAIRVLGGNIQAHAAGYRAQEDENPLVPLENAGEIVEAALAQPQVEAASQRIKTGGMATSAEGAFGVSIIGIEPEKELPVSMIGDPKNIADGRFLTSSDTDMVFIGQGLASAMGVKAGDRITLVGNSSHKQVRKRTMTVAGVYDLDMPSLEKQTVYISLAEAQHLYDMSGTVTEVVIMLKKMGEEPAVLKALKPRFTGAEIDSWETNFPELTSAVNRKSSVMDVFSLIMLVVAAIGILNLLTMAVYERTREIGVMGALGMKPNQISLLFLIEGAIMGVVGVAFGVVLGLLINFILSKVGMDYSSFTGLTEYTAMISGQIYTTLGVEKLPIRSLTALIVSLLASILPAYEAAQHEPAKALHFV